MATISQGVAALKGGFIELINVFGTDFAATRTDDTTYTLKAHRVPATKADEHYVNSLGVDSVFLHALADIEPKKYDRLVCPATNDNYIVQDIQPVVLEGTLLGYRVVAK